MIIINGSSTKYLFSLLIFFLLLISATNVVFSKQDQISFLSQDLNYLENSNGRIVESRSVNVKSEWSDKIESYKIKYLSDSLLVVGFIVKPKTGGSKFPAIIFNRGGNREYGKINKE